MYDGDGDADPGPALVLIIFGIIFLLGILAVVFL